MGVEQGIVEGLIKLFNRKGNTNH